MDASIVVEVAKRIIIIEPPPCWELHPKTGERIVISRSHPALDSITSGVVTGSNRKYFTMEWKLPWGHFEKFASEKHSMDKRCPKGHYRIDLEVEAISTSRMTRALYKRAIERPRR